MPKCHIHSCLGHADERTVDVVCTRCGGQRWTVVHPAAAPDPADYLCLRCSLALAGGNVLDPLVTDARRAHLARIRHDQPIGQGKAVGIS
jgi:hypothetical protein